MNYLSKTAIALGSLSALSAAAHPGHDHGVQSSLHMVTNNLMIVAVIIGVLLSLRALTSRK